jgi:F0F1-type ATP synthase membrane subunit b/b'
MELMFGLLFIASALGFIPVAIWAFVLRTRWQRTQRSLSEVEQELTTVRADSIAERDRLRREVSKRLDDVDAELSRERGNAQAEAERVRAHFEEEFRKAMSTFEPLLRFQGFANAEQETKRVLDEAIKLASALKQQAETFSAASRSRSEIELREASNKLKELRSEADSILSKATKDARRILDEAHKNAEQIAGNAYIALREKDTLEQAVHAIRNVIDGYGDRYVVPTRSLLDELASDFGHLDAGVKLKSARDQSRRMAEEGHAAECDYAEAKRRETAIRFVIDAFNGRVDGILSRTRNDNYGTLEQEIRDAFALVNLNGEAFRNARILDAYLAARLEELKWAVVGQELRLREREEQRRIQEQIREEEKARREAERVMKETQK